MKGFPSFLQFRRHGGLSVDHVEDQVSPVHLPVLPHHGAHDHKRLLHRQVQPEAEHPGQEECRIQEVSNQMFFSVLCVSGSGQVTNVAFDFK